MAASPNSNERISWPKRAVVTAGMPYGNKPLHFGHIAGVFVPADAFARFLRDRIGAANVRFISGTDCFGSPINEGYRKLVEAGATQMSFFANTRDLEREERLETAVDALRERFGGGSVRRGTVLEKKEREGE